MQAYFVFCSQRTFFWLSHTSKKYSGCNRRRGRPRLTASALDYQLNEVESVLSDTASESEIPPKKAPKRKKKFQEVESKSDFDIFEDNVEKEPIKPAKSKIVINQFLRI